MIRWTYAFIDRPRDGFARGAAFWSAVTGTRLSPPRGAQGEFATLLPADADAWLKVQAVGDDGGVHVDLATQDIHTLARNAVAGGASLVAELDGFYVLRSPGGILLCSVPWEAQSSVSPPHAAPDGSLSRVDRVRIDVPAPAFEEESAFWSRLTQWQATGPEPSDAASGSGRLLLTPPAPLPISLLLRPSERTGGRAAARLDLACSDREATRAHHERHGAITVDSTARSTTLRDPAGGTYLLSDRDPLAAA